MGFEILMEDEDSIVRIPMDQKSKEEFRKRNANLVQPEVFLKKFLRTEENYKKVCDTLEKAAEDSIPEAVKKKCLWCQGLSSSEEDKGCEKYKLQMLITFKLVAVEFVDVVRGNRHILSNDEVVFELTKEFYKSIFFLKGKGLMGFDMRRLMHKTLKMGFLSLNDMFLKTKHLSKSLRVINSTLHALDNEGLQYKLNGEEIPEHITLQQDFFTSKQSFYKEEQRLNRLEKLEKVIRNNSNSNGNRPNRTDIAYFCFYTSESKELITENSFPSKKAWKEIGAQYSKDDTNIQKAYNRIANNKGERLKNSKADNINFVLKEMLENYPKAKKLALEELKLLKIN
ncbi:hypothetical protein [Flagellimonas flava]|uniref:hypothetical protein n=1 Tax=Flagellimonas flava TaxID=570519 RepID=UPI00093479C2|nr:hypothetical protein [Allomuricauda flava]